MTSFLTALAGIVSGIFGLAKLLTGLFTKSTQDKIQDIHTQVNQEESSFEKDGRPHE